MNICSEYKKCLGGYYNSEPKYVVRCACQYPHEEDECCEKESHCLIVGNDVKCVDIRKIKIDNINDRS